ncbi:MAG: glycerophosphodiester phosphodiesterase family protein [Acidobacteria bacterium]|nr:glycerophosphodiester phosphodiesterase family protein [Acidobacteriota bacterium]MBI3655042.1 glycerophosphodiester phosphodiesterase family protein [Acidobacteriota bacterium]
MRKLSWVVWLAFGVIFLSALVAAAKYPSPNVDLDVMIRNRDWDGAVVTAHNGGILYGPQDTLFVFNKSYENGADIIEMDIRVTADDELIAFHDDTFTWYNSTGQGLVRERTLDYVRSILARSFIPGVPNQPIPTLREGFQFLRARQVCGNIEPKDDVEAAIVRLAVEEGVLNQILIQIKSPERAAALRALNPNAAMIARIRRESDVAAYAPYNPEVAEVDPSISDEAIAELRRMGARVQMKMGYLPLDPGSERAWRARIARGVNVVLTDLIPNLVRFVRREAFNVGNEAMPREGGVDLAGMTILDLNGPSTAEGDEAALRVLMFSLGEGKLKIFRDQGDHYERVAETAMVPLREGLNILRVEGALHRADLIGIYLTAGEVEAGRGVTGRSLWIAGDAVSAPKDMWTPADYILSLDGSVR